MKCVRKQCKSSLLISLWEASKTQEICIKFRSTETKSYSSLRGKLHPVTGHKILQHVQWYFQSTENVDICFYFKFSCNVNNKSTTIWLVQRLLALLTQELRDTNALLVLLGPQPEDPITLQKLRYALCIIYVSVLLKFPLAFPVVICITFLNHSSL